MIPAISIPEDGPVYLRVITTQEGLYAKFFYSLDGKDYQELAEVPTNILTDEQSDGFTGAHFGMYCHDMTGGDGMRILIILRLSKRVKNNRKGIQPLFQTRSGNYKVFKEIYGKISNCNL